MVQKKYIYSFTYDHFEEELCKLESLMLFNEKDDNKQLHSAIKTTPSSSAFIKNRLDIICHSEDYGQLIANIKGLNICVEGFKVEYLVFNDDDTEYGLRLEKLKDIGYSIEGTPDYYHPTVIYALCFLGGFWYFGSLTKNNYKWLEHKKKPSSYSNSISIKIAKSLVNIATKGDKSTTLLDACCGVGTIMLEANYAGYNIEGSDINWKICRGARANLAHFNYESTVYRTDIKDISKKYDAIIVDLPYNLLSKASISDVIHIITSAGKITERMVIVSTSDITNIISEAGFNIIEVCSVGKSGKRMFARKVWVCVRRLE